MSAILDIRLPEAGGTPEQQLKQLRSYLFMLTQQLQFAMSETGAAAPAAKAEAAAPSAAASFTSLKSLIIKSADIVNAYYDEISRRLEGIYVAQSDFGTFTQQTAQQIQENADGIRRSFENYQQLLGTVDAVQNQLTEVNAYIKAGLLYYDPDSRPVYGVEIGQQDTIDGVVGFQKFVRLTPDRLSFYDNNDNEVAYISDRRLYITGAQIRELTAGSVRMDTLHMGGYTWSLSQGEHLTLA